MLRLILLKYLKGDERVVHLFVIQSYPDSKLFEVLSREIVFDHHIDLIN